MPERRRSSESGSVLLLFPAAFLIVLVLGAIAIDAGVAFMRQRELAVAAGAAANDALAISVEDSIARGDGLVIDPIALESAVVDSLDRRGILDTLTEAPDIEIIGTDQVRITLRGRADHVIGPALPGGADGTPIRATATARLVVDDG